MHPRMARLRPWEESRGSRLLHVEDLGTGDGVGMVPRVVEGVVLGVRVGG